LTAAHEAGLREAVCDGEIWKLNVTTAPEPEIDEPIESSHAPMISVDAQDEDDWNDWQNWNSRS